MVAFGRFLKVVVAVLFIASADSRAMGTTAAQERGVRTIQVSGSGMDFLDTAIVHSSVPTPNGMIQKSTETVELTGDLTGRVLYHVTSVFDFEQGTLVNTGDQVYSGTIAGSDPVLIHDDKFRFDVNLTTGEETGRVYLFNNIAGPNVTCALNVVGTGVNSQGNPLFDYTGSCTFRGR